MNTLFYGSEKFTDQDTQNAYLPLVSATKCNALYTAVRLFNYVIRPEWLHTLSINQNHNWI